MALPPAPPYLPLKCPHELTYDSFNFRIGGMELIGDVLKLTYYRLNEVVSKYKVGEKFGDASVVRAVFKNNDGNWWMTVECPYGSMMTMAQQ